METGIYAFPSGSLPVNNFKNYKTIDTFQIEIILIQHYRDDDASYWKHRIKMIPTDPKSVHFFLLSP